MMKNIFLFALLVWLPSYVYPECCPKVEVNFVKSNGDVPCEDFGGTIPFPSGGSTLTVGGALSKVQGSIINKECVALVCGNGKPPSSGTYCGRGPCNIFGCNCDGGCVSGDAVEEFIRIHEADIDDAWYT